MGEKNGCRLRGRYFVKCHVTEQHTNFYFFYLSGGRPLRPLWIRNRERDRDTPITLSVALSLRDN